MRKPFWTASVLLTALVLIGATTGWTVAWLTSQPQTVKNTFTVGNIRIRLEETLNTDTNEDQIPDMWQGILIPGTTLFKDPTVTVLADCEDCWLFVQLKESAWPSAMEFDGQTRKVAYAIAEGWQLLPGESNTYFREAKRTAQEMSFPVLQNHEITVSENLTKTELKNLGQPKLTIAAYAVQQAGFDTVAEAWNEVKPSV